MQKQRNRNEKIVRIFPGHIEISTIKPGIISEETSIERINIEDIPAEGLEIVAESLKIGEKEETEIISARKKKKKTEPKQKIKSKKEKEKEKTGKKIVMVKDARFVGSGQLPGTERTIEIYEKDGNFFLRQRPGSLKLTRAVTEGKYGKMLKKFKEYLPGDKKVEDYHIAKALFMDTFRPRVKERGFNKFMLVALAKGDLIIEREGVLTMVKPKEETQ